MILDYHQKKGGKEKNIAIFSKPSNELYFQIKLIHFGNTSWCIVCVFPFHVASNLQLKYSFILKKKKIVYHSQVVVLVKLKLSFIAMDSIKS